MPSKSSTQQRKDYILITNVTRHPTEAEIDLDAEIWELAYTIEDEDLTFDGKPLNMLYEENRWQAGHHVIQSRDQQSNHSSSHGKEKSYKTSRGRTRQK